MMSEPFAAPTEMACGPDVVSLEDTPLTRPEYLSVMVHFYRAEVARSTSWRQRLDATTNWAVLTSAAMMSFAFATPEHSHFLLLLSNLVILAFLFIEARRYRFFEVYRARVRMLEENFIQPIVTRRLDSPMKRWREAIAGDLDQPKYKCSLWQAVGFRLRRNYLFIFTTLMGAWVVKLGLHPDVAQSLGDLWTHAEVGKIPPGVVIGGAVLFYLALCGLMALGWRIHAGEGPTDEIAGVQTRLEDWKL